MVVVFVYSVRDEIKRFFKSTKLNGGEKRRQKYTPSRDESHRDERNTKDFGEFHLMRSASISRGFFFPNISFHLSFHRVFMTFFLVNYILSAFVLWAVVFKRVNFVRIESFYVLPNGLPMGVLCLLEPTPIVSANAMRLNLLYFVADYRTDHVSSDERIYGLRKTLNYRSQG